MSVLDKWQSLKACHTWHHLVEDYKVVGRATHHLHSIVAIVAGVHLIAFAREEHNVRLEKIYLIVNPKYLIHISIRFYLLPYNASMTRIIVG